MKRIAYASLVFVVLMTLITSTHAITISAAKFFTEFAFPVPQAFTSCPGLYFTTPDADQQLMVSFSFKTGTVTAMACNGTQVGTASVSASCPSPMYQPNTTYCVTGYGLNKLSTLANAGSSASCVEISGGGDVTQGSLVNCTAVGACNYTGTTTSLVPHLVGAAC